MNHIERILARLSEIEQEENVSIFFACESGSRAWGFPSADSDYDVRFLYVRPRDWYLSIDVEDRRDVIERPISDNLDFSGWDLRKALKLLRKSNPPLLEWLNSPIVYREMSSITAGIRGLVREFYSPIACQHHYLSMARGNYREFEKNELIRVKKYFYVLRPLLAVKWIEQESEPVPMELGSLVDRCVSSPEVSEAIANLIERKKRGLETDREPRIEVISGFIEYELERLGKKKVATPPKSDPERLNELFRMALVAAAKLSTA